jgi:hypothetical protein
MRPRTVIGFVLLCLLVIAQPAEAAEVGVNVQSRSVHGRL